MAGLVRLLNGNLILIIFIGTFPHKAYGLG